MLIPRLLQKNTLTFTRKTTNGTYDDSGNWVEGVDEPSFNVKGSLQPFERGNSREDLPEGVSANDIRVFYTATELKTIEEYNNQESDSTTINGIEYICYFAEDWFTPAYRLSHYKVFLIKKDKI